MKFVPLFVFLLYFTLAIDAERIKIHTWSHTSAPQYQIFPLKTNYLELNVMATQDIKILLCNNYNLIPPYYEIVIGAHNNTVSLIRKAQDGKWLETHHEVILANKEFQKFWISMNDTDESISVGRRHGQPFLHLKDPNYVKMEYFGLSNGSGAEAVWDFDMAILKWNDCNNQKTNFKSNTCSQCH